MYKECKHLHIVHNLIQILFFYKSHLYIKMEDIAPLFIKLNKKQQMIPKQGPFIFLLSKDINT